MKTVTPISLLTKEQEAALTNKPKLKAMYEEYLRWATESFGLELSAAQANLPAVTGVQERNEAIVGGMRSSAAKTSLQPLRKGLVEECIISPYEPNHGGYAGHRRTYERFEGPLGSHQADHLCEVRNCWNSAHMVRATQGANMARAAVGGAMRWTHCSKGHALSGRNVYRRSTGELECRKCANTRQAARRAAGNATGIRNAQKTHCVNGHRLSGDNVHLEYKVVDGVKVLRKRRCKSCWQEQSARRHAAALEAKAASLKPEKAA